MGAILINFGKNRREKSGKKRDNYGQVPLTPQRYVF
jgi:hypothetical protein